MRRLELAARTQYVHFETSKGPAPRLSGIAWDGKPAGGEASCRVPLASPAQLCHSPVSQIQSAAKMEQAEGDFLPAGGTDRAAVGGSGSAGTRQNGAGDAAPSWERAQERAGLLGGGGGLLSAAAPPLSSRPSSPWHALEIHSSDDGSGHYNGGKAAAGVGAGVAAADPAAALRATDATERLLPPLAAVPDALPGGITPRKRLYMVVLFALTASLLNADQNLMAPNLTAIAAGAQAVAAPNNANALRLASAPSRLGIHHHHRALCWWRCQCHTLWHTVRLMLLATFPALDPCRFWL